MMKKTPKLIMSFLIMTSLIKKLTKAAKIKFIATLINFIGINNRVIIEHSHRLPFFNRATFQDRQHDLEWRLNLTLLCLNINTIIIKPANTSILHIYLAKLVIMLLGMAQRRHYACQLDNTIVRVFIWIRIEFKVFSN